MNLGTDEAFAELGLAFGATEAEVKAAWRRLVSQWHPDRNDSAGAVARIQRINRAFEQIRLSRMGAEPEDAAPEAATPASADEAAAGFEPDDDGTAGAQRRRPPIHRKVKLTLEEAAAGCIKVLRGKLTETCAVCDGVGHRVLGKNCLQCRGAGAIFQRSWFGWPGVRTECEACQGSGMARQTCQACDGSGKEAPQHYQVNVRIPQGVRHGDLLHVDARRPRQGRPPADLEIRVELLPHALFQLDDDGTIRCEMPVDGFAWVTNRPIQVPTLSGLQPLQLNRDRLSYSLKGEGFPVKRGGARGDQQITLAPVFPAQFSTDQQILIDQLIAASAGADGQPRDRRLRTWNQSLRAWEQGLSQRGQAASE